MVVKSPDIPIVLMAHRSGKIRLAALAMVALLPSFLKRFCFRWFFGYRIAKGVQIGFSLIDARECEIGEGTSIGHLNVIINVGNLKIGDHVKIGHLNIIRGGDEVNLGRYAEIIRLNEINSIPDPIVVNRTDPRFMLGEGSIVTTNHKIDFTDKVEIGRRSIIGGRNSSLWTHNRQATKPIKIGSLAYIGSEIRMAPGSAVPSYCVVGMGSVITAAHAEEKSLIAGVPARVVKQLGEEDMLLVERKTRPDLPDDI